MTNEIATHTDTPLTQADQTFTLLQQAVAQGADPANLEKLLDLQERVQQREADSEINNAMAQFQARCPAIEKRKTVKDRGGRLLYRFAPLEDIIEQIRPLIAELGLSFSFDTDVLERGVEVVCTIRHRGGGSVKSRVFVPATKGHNTNAAQDAGIQLAYGKRYAIINALGITTADEDPDARQATVAPIEAKQVTTLQKLIDSTGADREKFLKYLGVSSLSELPQNSYDRAVAALKAKGARS